MSDENRIPDTEPAPMFTAVHSGEYVRISAVDCSYLISTDNALAFAAENTRAVLEAERVRNARLEREAGL